MDIKRKWYLVDSLDGYIADSNGGVGWFNGHGSDHENIDVYTEFVMGRIWFSS